MLQGTPSGTRQPVFGLGDPSRERLGAGDVGRLLELARVYAQVAVRGLQERLELVEAEAVVHGERAHDAEAHALVDQPVELGGTRAGAGARPRDIPLGRLSLSRYSLSRPRTSRPWSCRTPFAAHRSPA